MAATLERKQSSSGAQSANRRHRRFMDRTLCQTALGSSKSRWDDGVRYQIYIEAARRRNLSVGDCRVPGKRKGSLILLNQKAIITFAMRR